MNHWVTGWVDWNMALNIQGGPSWISHKLNAPIIIDAEYDVFYKNPMYYHLGHFRWGNSVNLYSKMTQEQ